MSDSTPSFWREVLFKTLPPVLLSLAVFLSTLEYNNRQVDIKKIEIANNFFNEITEDAEPTPEMLDLKEEFIRRVLKENDSSLIRLMRRAIKLNYENKIKKSKELFASASSQTEKAAALSELGHAIENAQSFQIAEIHQVGVGHQKEYDQYKQYKEAENLNKKAIQNVESGNQGSAYKQLKEAQTIYPDYPGIKKALEKTRPSDNPVTEDPQVNKTKADQLKSMTLEPVQVQRKELREKMILKRYKE